MKKRAIFFKQHSIPLLLGFILAWLVYYQFYCFEYKPVKGKEELADSTNNKSASEPDSIDVTLPAGNSQNVTSIDTNKSVGFKWTFLPDTYLLTDTAEKKAADSLQRTERIKLLNSEKAGSYKSLSILTCLLFIIAASYLGIYFIRRRGDGVMATPETDPADLTAAFKAFKTDIKLINNPRKIKRYVNKVRFQYNVIQCNTDYKEKCYAFFLVKALLEFEHPTQPNLKKQQGKELEATAKKRFEEIKGLRNKKGNVYFTQPHIDELERKYISFYDLILELNNSAF